MGFLASREASQLFRRRRSPAFAAVAISTLLLTCLEPRVSGADDCPKPNVVLIFADDLGYGDLGCYGHQRFKTPHLDRMAAEGARLTNVYVPVPYCAPSRGTILTGRYPFRHGVIRNPCPDANVNDVGIPDSEILLSESLQQADYATCCIGKWHLGHQPQFYPTRHGFDEYYGILYSNDMRPVQLLENDHVVEYPVVQCTLTRRYTERAVDFIERNRKRPFFLYLPHAMPHKPLAPSEEFYQKSGAGLYADVISELDWSVGEVLKKIEALGLEEKTLVLFTSDNGPWFGGSTGGLRGMKSRTWEGGIRVPLIARWPGRIPAGHVSDALAGTIDVLPTVLKLAAIPLPQDRTIDGRDIWPLLTSQSVSLHEAIYAMGGPRLMTVRSGRWKLHVHPPATRLLADQLDDWIDPRGPDGVTILAPFEQYMPREHPGVLTGDQPKPMMLFDLDSDPAEQHDVAGQHPDVVRRLKKLFDAMNEQVSTENEKRPGVSRAGGSSKAVGIEIALDCAPPIKRFSAHDADGADNAKQNHRQHHGVFDRGGGLFIPNK